MARYNILAWEVIHSGETVLLSTQKLKTKQAQKIKPLSNTSQTHGPMLARQYHAGTGRYSQQNSYVTIELYEMWCSEIYDRDLTSVGRIHHAMIQRGGGQGLLSPLPLKNHKKYRVS